MSRGLPFLLYRAGDGGQLLLELSSGLDRVAIGRRRSCELALPWDAEVSRVHAELVRMGTEWVIYDDGLSHNGTFVNGDRIRGRRRLRAGDVIQVGGTLISMCGPEHHSTAAPTRAARGKAVTVVLTPAQRRLLVALCRPLREAGYAAPASNRELAAELVISLDTVKGTLTALFELFGLSALPQNQKRTMLAVRALTLLSADRSG
jgi:pSer/pThr/pTyr-binding forkhead associated (FHA) protein